MGYAGIQDQLTDDTWSANCMDTINRKRLGRVGCAICGMPAPISSPTLVLREQIFRQTAGLVFT
jgi:hypothetical protein